MTYHQFDVKVRMDFDAPADLHRAAEKLPEEDRRKLYLSIQAAARAAFISEMAKRRVKP
jgi:hypothetical protein